MYCYPYPGMTVARYTCRTCNIKVNEDILEKSLKHMLNRISLAPEDLSGDKNNVKK